MRVQTPQNKSFTAKLVADQQAIPKPAWLKIRPPKHSEKFAEIKKLLKEKNLNTVCAEAHCPNISECWSGDQGSGDKGSTQKSGAAPARRRPRLGGGGATATFMIMGDTCTRACRFCMVKSGKPVAPPDPHEPENLAEAVRIMGLEYVVLTCVTRDDLPDGGASHWVACVAALKKAHPKLIVELLISDLDGNLDALKTIVTGNGNPAHAPHVLAHNIETIERLQSAIRDPRANYAKSLAVLANAKKFANGLNKPKNSPKHLRAQTFSANAATATKTQNGLNKPKKGHKVLPGQTFPNPAHSAPLRVPPLYTKTSLMLGLGETEKEIIQTMKDLRAPSVNVDVITFGQYLRPSPFHIAVHEYVTPAAFKNYQQLALKHGFLYCASGPFVRSSYKAGEYFLKNVIYATKAKN